MFAWLTSWMLPLRSVCIKKNWSQSGIRLTWLFSKHATVHIRVFSYKQCTSSHPLFQRNNIRFTWECTAGWDPVNYMDLKISIDSDNKLTHELFQKPSDSGVNLNLSRVSPDTKRRPSQHSTFEERPHFPRTQRHDSVAKIKSRLCFKITASLAKRSNSLMKGPTNSQPPARTRQTAALKVWSCTCHLVQTIWINRFAESSASQTSRLGWCTNRHQTWNQRLVRSVLLPSGCTIHGKFVEEQQQSKRRPGRPREDCISCRAELKETRAHCDRQFAVCALTCTICSKEYIGETQRPIRARVQEHFAETRNRRKDTPWGEHVLSFHKDIDCAQEKTLIFTAHILAFLHGPHSGVWRKRRSKESEGNNRN